MVFVELGEAGAEVEKGGGPGEEAAEELSVGFWVERGREV